MKNIDGGVLLRMSREQFLCQWPPLVGEVPWEHINYLKTQPTHTTQMKEVIRSKILTQFAAFYAKITYNYSSLAPMFRFLDQNLAKRTF
jgi:hypothetical protein